MQMLKTVSLMGLGLLLAGILRAEPLFPSEHSWVPEEPYAWTFYTYDGEASLKDIEVPGRMARVIQQEGEAAAFVPVLSTPDVSMGLGVYYVMDDFDFTSFSAGDHYLHMLAVPIDVIYQGLIPWSFWAEVSPGLFTDFNGMTWDDYRTMGHVLAMYDLSSSLRLAGGVGYDREFGDDKVFPMGGVRWQPHRSWDFNLILPMPRVTYAPISTWTLFAEAMPAGNKWNIREQGDNYDFKLESYRLAVGTEYALTRWLWAQAAVGADVNRNYKIQNDREDILDSDAADTWFVRIGLLAR